MKFTASFAVIFLSGCQASDTLRTPLTTVPGNAAAGLRVFTDRDKGHCILCHQISGLDVEFQGTLGPDLTAVGTRLSPSQLRLRIVDYDRLRPGTTMPSYYRVKGLHQVKDSLQNKTVLSGQDIEDIIAYLSDLTGEKIP